MVIRYSLTSDLRLRLKQPLGILVRGSFAKTMKRLREMVRDEKPPVIISVGDTVSRNLAKNQLFPKLAIVDNKCMRRSIRPVSVVADRTVQVRNPQGTITEEAVRAIKEAFDGKQRVRILVDGEEDLLALTAIAYGPKDSFVVYGQPYEGIVVVKITSEKRAEIFDILKSMEVGSKN